MDKILINSDVILSVLYNRQPLAEDAAKMLSLCESRKIEGLITNFTLANVYNELSKISDFQNISEKLSLLLTFLDIQEVQKKEMLEALHSDFTDLEHAVLSVVAENTYSISAIVTENINEFKNNRVQVLTPAQYLNP